MSSDAIKSNVTHAAGIILAWAAGRYHLSSDQVGLIMSDVAYVGSALAFLYGVYAHLGMKKVPVNSVVVKTAGALVLFLAAAAVSLSFAGSARAADLSVKAPAPFAIPGNPCTSNACTGLYGGAFIGGLGDNANILGNGINGSFTNGGMLPGADIGWQYFDGKFLFAIEADAGYQFGSNTAISGSIGSFDGAFGIIQAKAGASLAQLSPSFTSLNLPLTIITPYAAGGEMVQQRGGAGGVGGGGHPVPARHQRLELPRCRISQRRGGQVVRQRQYVVEQQHLPRRPRSSVLSCAAGARAAVNSTDALPPLD